MNVSSKPPLRVAAVDDDPDFLRLLIRVIERAGGQPTGFSTAEKAQAAIERGEFDAVFTDLQLPLPEHGEAVVQTCRGDGRRVPVAVVSVLNSAEIALRLGRLGADDYLMKPVAASELLGRVRTFLESARIARDAREVRSSLEPRGTTASSAILAASPALRPLLELLPRAARCGANVLITGESGTGKELAARAVHELSPRASGPFLAVDCGAIPEALAENELFGHRRGAFSDARESQDGLVQQANEGTLFLDEIGELGLPMQAKLLRFMQTKEYRRLGDPRVFTADVRIVAATNRDLADEVRSGTFRQDLYFRLNVVRLALPPLRERREDIPILATAFLHRYAAEFSSPALAFSAAALRVLQERDWDGNVRELENSVQSAVAMATESIVGADAVRSEERDVRRASGAVRRDQGGPRPSEKAKTGDGRMLDYHEAKQQVVDAFERRYAAELLERHGGRIGAAASEAGLDRKSLSRLVARHALRDSKEATERDRGPDDDGDI